MSHLPPEIIIDILSRLPVKSLLRFLCVSKPWYPLINNSNFIKLHLQRSIEANRDRTLIFDNINSSVFHYFFAVHFPTENHFDNAFKLYQPLFHLDKIIIILDYCHGLVCIHHFFEKIKIWNPLIQKYRILPTEPRLKACKASHIAFGYDLCNDDYKVLRVTNFRNGGRPLNEFEVKVYSLRSHSWRKIEDQWPKKECTISYNYSVSLNGALHWLIDEELECLVAFDLATEKFRVFETPVQQEQEFELTTFLNLEVLK